MTPLIYVLNGPNLNLLGKRQPHIYGHETLADVEADCRKLAAGLGLDMRFHQSNREYEIIDWVHEARETASGIVINPAAFTHTSVAILDALNASDHRGAYFQRAQARGIPAPLLHLADCFGCDRRFRHPRLSTGDPAAGNADQSCQSLIIQRLDRLQEGFVLAQTQHRGSGRGADRPASLRAYCGLSRHRVERLD